jgi:hypothetical protein
MKSVTLRIFAAFFFAVGIITAPLLAQAAPCSPSMTFTTGQTLTAAVLNSNPTTFSGCFNNIDNTNIGAAGLYASQLLPTNASQATFGGGQNYTFTNNLTVSGTLTAAIIGGLYPSAIVPTTGAQATFGGTQTYTFPSNVNVLGGTTTRGLTSASGALQQTVGSTYTLPYDANSTAGSTNTHIEHGALSATFGGGVPSYACATSQTFVKAFTSAPVIVGIFQSASLASIYMNTKSATAFQMCAESSTNTTATTGFDWIAIGE